MIIRVLLALQASISIKAGLQTSQGQGLFGHDYHSWGVASTCSHWVHLYLHPGRCLHQTASAA
jgi:hypothetical protein